MRKLLATTATIVAMSTTAMADAHGGPFIDMTFDEAINLNASELIGSRVYATEADIENNMVADGGETEWDDIGEINEIVLTRDGTVQSVIVGVGGFLGMGEKDVAISMDQLQFISDGEEADDYFLVVRANAVGVQDAPDYTGSNMEDIRADVEDMAENVETEAEMAEEQMDAAATSPFTAPEIERDGYQTVMSDDLNTEDLTGARVYDINDNDIGEVSELLLTDDGKLDRAVIDVGGFIGIGEYPVALDMEELQLKLSDDGSDMRIYVDATQEQLETRPEYDG